MRAAAVLAAAFVLTACGARAPIAEDLGDRLAAEAEAWRRRTPVPAVVALVAGPEVGEHIVASGTLHRNGTEPVRPDTPFRAASITKTLVATVALQLEGEGRLSLKDPVGKYFRSGATDRLTEGVTVRDLLAHTSGLPDSSRSRELNSLIADDSGRRWTVADVLRLVAGAEREFAPGSAYGYSNTNYLVLGEVVEAVTGRPWYTEVRERILDPAGMASSYIAGLEPRRGALAPGYFDLDNDGDTEEVADPWPSLETTEGAAGALVSTAPDLKRFMEALAGGRLLSEEALAQMTQPGKHSSRYTGYGLGVEVLHPDLRTLVWGHGGLLPGFRGVLWFVPSRRLTIVVLTNESRSRPDGLAELTLKAVMRASR